MKKCPICNTSYNDSDSFCENCGCKLENADNPTVQKKKMSKSVKTAIIIVAVLAVIAMIIAGIFLFFHMKDNNQTEENTDTTESFVDTTVSDEKVNTPETTETTTASDTDSVTYYVLASMTDENGTTTFSWEGATCCQTDPYGNITYYTFNDDGSTKDITIGGNSIKTDGVDAQYTYSTTGDILRKIHSDGSVEDFTYDYEGKLVRYERTDDNSYRTVSYTYSQAGRIEKSELNVRPDKNSATSYITTTYYFYDNDGNVTKQEWVSTWLKDNLTSSGSRTFTYTPVTKEEFNIYVNSEILTNINVRLNVYTNKLIVNDSK